MLPAFKLFGNLKRIGAAIVILSLPCLAPRSSGFFPYVVPLRSESSGGHNCIQRPASSTVVLRAAEPHFPAVMCFLSSYSPHEFPAVVFIAGVEFIMGLGVVWLALCAVGFRH